MIIQGRIQASRATQSVSEFVDSYVIPLTSACRYITNLEDKVEEMEAILKMVSSHCLRQFSSTIYLRCCDSVCYRIPAPASSQAGMYSSGLIRNRFTGT